MCTADEPEDILARSSIAYTVSTNKFFKSDDGKQESFFVIIIDRWIIWAYVFWA